MIALLPLIVSLSIGTENFKLKLAVTEKERIQGLMYKEALERDEGMLFVIPENQRLTDSPCMWMKHTFVSLDMIFTNASGKILDIIEHTQPHSLELACPQSAFEKIAYVFELSAGAAQRADLKQGYTINLLHLKNKFPIF